MKRLALIAGIVACAALGVGAFVLGGSDNSTSAKGPSTSSSSNEAKDAANKITDADKVSALPPVPPTKKGDDNEGDDGEIEGYEVKSAFIGVSPPKVKAGEELKVEIKNFPPRTEVAITFTPSIGKTVTVRTDKKGKAKWEGKAPKGITLPATYNVSASAFATSASTTFTVVAKK